MSVVEMGKRGPGSLWAALGMAVVFVSGGSLPLAGQELKSMSIPLPVVIEGKPTPSKMYLKVEMKNINQSFDQFAAGKTDKAEAMFVKAVQAVRKKDVAAFGSVWSAPDQMKSTGQTKVVKMADNGPDGWMKVIQSVFDFNKLTVVAELLAGPDTMFIWDSETKSGVLRRALYVGPDKSGSVRLSAPGGNNPIDDMLQSAFVAAQADPNSYKPVPGLNLHYQAAVPLGGEKSAGAHPVVFEFDGMPVDLPLNDEKVKAPSPLLDFFRKADVAIHDERYDAYVSDFTPKSQEKVKQWTDAQEKTKQEKLKQEKLQEEKKLEEQKLKPEQTTATKPAVPPDAKAKAAAPPPLFAHAKFVLNADPIFLVFQAPGGGSGWAPAKLTYTYVLHQGDDYKITNFEYANTLDEFLQNPALFDKNVLKPPPVKAAAPNAKSVTEPAKPTTVNTK